MPAFHFDRRQLRRTAWVTLVVWVFALAAGVVNACALTPAGSTGRGIAPVSHVDIAAHEVDEGALVGAGRDGERDQVAPVLPHGQGHDAGKDSCLKFCDDESSAVAKAQLPVVDPGAGLPTSLEGWKPMAAFGAPGFLRALERPGSQGPPLVIRFLRLTL